MVNRCVFQRLFLFVFLFVALSAFGSAAVATLANNTIWVPNDGNQYNCTNISSQVSDDSMIRWDDSSSTCILNQSMKVHGILNITGETWIMNKPKRWAQEVNQTLWINGRLIFHDSTFKTNGSNATYGYNVSFNSTTNVSLSYSNVQHLGAGNSGNASFDNGWVIFSSSNLDMKTLNFSNGYAGIIIRDSGTIANNVNITQSNFTNMTRENIAIVSLGNSTIGNNTFRNNNFDSGIKLGVTALIHELDVSFNTFVDFLYPSSFANTIGAFMLNAPSTLQHNISLFNNTFNNTNMGVRIARFGAPVVSGGDYLITNNTFNGGCTGGSGGTAKSCVNIGFTSPGHSGNVEVSHNTINNVVTGITITTLHDGIITYNTFTNFSGSDSRAIATIGSINFTNYSYNTFKNSNNSNVYGIWHSTNSLNNTFQYNNFSNVTTAMILAAASSTGNLISRNYFYQGSNVGSDWIIMNATLENNFMNDSMYGNWYENGSSWNLAGNNGGYWNTTVNSTNYAWAGSNWSDQKPVSCFNGWNGNTSCITIRTSNNTYNKTFIAQLAGNMNFNNCTLYTNKSGWAVRANDSSLVTGENATVSWSDDNQTQTLWNFQCQQNDTTWVTANRNFTFTNKQPQFGYTLRLTNNTAGSKDTYVLDDNNVNATMGGVYGMIVGRGAGGANSIKKARAFFQWNNVTIPTHLSLGSVTLALKRFADTTLGGGANTGVNQTIRVFRVNQTWYEAEGNLVSGKPQNSSNSLNGTSWMYQYFGSGTWMSMESYHDSTITSQYVNQTMNTSVYTDNPAFNITVLVKEWLNATYSNLGLLLKSNNEGGSADYITYASTENATSDNRPTIFYNYTVNRVNMSRQSNTSINVTTLFTDYEGEFLTYTCNATLATCTQNGDILNITTNTTVGQETIAITANDNASTVKTNDFVLNITCPATPWKQSANTCVRPNETTTSTTSSISTRSRTSTAVPGAKALASTGKMWATVAPGVTNTLIISNDKIPVKQVDFILASEGTNVDLTVKSYAAKPILITTEPATPVADYIEVEVENIEHLQSATLTFEVADSWLQEQGVSSEDVVLLHYSETADTWDDLKTTLLDSTDTIHTYEAMTYSFSYFAISVLGEETEVTPEEEDEPETETPAEVPETPPQTIKDREEAVEQATSLMAWILVIVVLIAGILAYFLYSKKK